MNRRALTCSWSNQVSAIFEVQIEYRMCAFLCFFFGLQLRIVIVRENCIMRIYVLIRKMLLNAHYLCPLSAILSFIHFTFSNIGLPYLDVIHRLRSSSVLPIAAYHVSGEYAMLKAAAQKVRMFCFVFCDYYAQFMESFSAMLRLCTVSALKLITWALLNRVGWTRRRLYWRR